MTEDAQADRRSGMPSIGLCCRAVSGVPVGWVRPRRPDRRFLAGLPDVAMAPSRVTVSTRVLGQRPRRVPTLAIAEGRFVPPRIELTMTSIVVSHPRARFLLDPAVCRDVRRRVIARMPAVLRPAVRPPRGIVPTVDAVDELPSDERSFDFALCTHAHWDHVSGLLDLPGTPLVLHGREHDAVLARDPGGGARDALADRELRRVDLDGPPVLSFTASHDLLGDGSVVLVDLTGHTAGSVGVVLSTRSGRVLVAGDAAWHSVQVADVRQKASYPGLLVDADRDETYRTLHRLHAASRSVRVVPSHDRVALEALSG